jgi:hypothetical protein
MTCEQNNTSVLDVEIHPGRETRKKNPKMEEKKFKVTIGIPTSGSVPWEFAASLMALRLLDHTRVVWLPRVMIDTARNTLVEEALKDTETTHLLMIDDDMTFNPDLLLSLISRNVDIVGSLAFKRRPGYEPCVYKAREDGELFPVLPTTFQEVDAIGTAGLLVNIDVFKSLKFPWFETYYDERGRHWSVDIDFCKKAKAAGYKIYVDTIAEMGHIGDAPVITQADFLKELKQHEIHTNNSDGNSEGFADKSL